MKFHGKYLNLIKEDLKSHEFDLGFWIRVSESKSLSEEFIEEFEDKICWGYICLYNLSEKFIEKHIDRLNWGSISFYCKLSESFIRKFNHKMDWQSIAMNQELSEEFIWEFKHKLSFYSDYIIQFQKVSDKFKIKFNSFAKFITTGQII